MLDNNLVDEYSNARPVKRSAWSLPVSSHVGGDQHVI